VIDILPVREKGPNSAARATQQCFHSNWELKARISIECVFNTKRKTSDFDFVYTAIESTEKIARLMQNVSRETTSNEDK